MSALKSGATQRGGRTALDNGQQSFPSTLEPVAAPETAPTATASKVAAPTPPASTATVAPTPPASTAAAPKPPAPKPPAPKPPATTVTASKPPASKPPAPKPPASKPPAPKAPAPKAAASKPAAPKPAASKPAASKPAAPKPAAPKAAASKPAASKPPASKPAASKPAASKPPASKPPAPKKEMKESPKAEPTDLVSTLDDPVPNTEELTFDEELFPEDKTLPECTPASKKMPDKKMSMPHKKVSIPLESAQELKPVCFVTYKKDDATSHGICLKSKTGCPKFWDEDKCQKVDVIKINDELVAKATVAPL